MHSASQHTSIHQPSCFLLGLAASHVSPQLSLEPGSVGAFWFIYWRAGSLLKRAENQRIQISCKHCVREMLKHLDSLLIFACCPPPGTNLPILSTKLIWACTTKKSENDTNLKSLTQSASNRLALTISLPCFCNPGNASAVFHWTLGGSGASILLSLLPVSGKLRHEQSEHKIKNS